jgi:adenylate kinase
MRKARATSPGSGKSTVIKFIRKQKVDGRKIDFGYYINADDLAADLRKGGIKFSRFGIRTARNEFKAIALASGLIPNIKKLNFCLLSGSDQTV